MWQCQKCLREFEKQNQGHFCSEQKKTIDNYINEQSEDIRPLLYELRNTLRATLPFAEERISWSMPTYWHKHNIIHFAAFKKHLGLYPGPDAIVHFSDQLQEYAKSKGAIQFPYNKPLPLLLIAQIARWCYDTGNHH